MSTRISSLVLLFTLSACQESQTNTQVLAEAEVNQMAEAADDGKINCALAGSDAFARVCTLDREQGPEGLILVARHPDGGFRRLRVTGDGHGVVAADGAEQAEVAIAGRDEIEVALGDDHYRLPATIKGQAAP
ncbi:hypothetical protein [Sphingomonas sp.]|jgi:hypothetical protein|uniref:hypothetical protein n=1 Tax=Sphingomonas sp. TaxID=28214 RepID=UPI0035C7B2B9